MNSKLTSFIITALLATITAVIAPSAQAQTIALNNVVNTSGNGTAESGWAGTIGFQFTLDNSATLDSLGLYVPVSGTANGLPNTVGIFDASGFLLARATVAVASNDPTGDFVYSSDLTFLSGFTGTLSANTTYEIGVQGQTDGEGNAVDFYINDRNNTFTPASGLNVIGAVYSADAGFAPPLIADGTPGEAYIGPNFTFTEAVPEPSTYALMFAGLGALAMVMRSRRTRA